MTAAPTLYCSFCGKSQHEVRKLIAGPQVFICNECNALCTDICREGGIAPFVGQSDDQVRRWAVELLMGRPGSGSVEDLLEAAAKLEAFVLGPQVALVGEGG